MVRRPQAEASERRGERAQLPWLPTDVLEVSRFSWSGGGGEGFQPSACGARFCSQSRRLIYGHILSGPMKTPVSQASLFEPSITPDSLGCVIKPAITLNLWVSKYQEA